MSAIISYMVQAYHTGRHPYRKISKMSAVERLVLSMPNFSLTQSPFFVLSVYQLRIVWYLGIAQARLEMMAVLMLRLVCDGRTHD